jgi:hypothetical protein
MGCRCMENKKSRLTRRTGALQPHSSQKASACGESAGLNSQCDDHRTQLVPARNATTSGLIGFAQQVAKSRFGGSFGTLRVTANSAAGTEVETIDSASSSAAWRRSSSLPVLHAEITSVRGDGSHRAAILTDQGEDDVDAVRTAETADAGIAPEEATPMSPSPKPAPAPTCTYAITYANQSNLGCGAGRCGARIQFDVTAVDATGGGCPATLNGLRVTEAVTTDNGCGPGGVQTGAGCPITATAANPRHGTIAGCTDTYGLCLPTASVPTGGCTETYTQQLSVGGVLAETWRIRFVLTNAAGACTGAVTRAR